MLPKGKDFKTAQPPDYVFVILAGLLVIVGAVFLASASSALGFQKFNDSYYYIKHQLFYGLIPGLIVCYFLSNLPYQRLKAWALGALLISLVLLLAVFIPGLGLNYGGASRWVHLGSFVIQPSELVKITFILYLAAWFSGRETAEINSITKGVLPFLLTVGLVTGLIILQPDLGTASVILAASFLIYISAGAKVSHLATLGGVGLSFLWLLIKFVPYRASRLMVFLHPEFDPQGVGYHINQALLAVGSGGLFGVGLGYSRQKYQYLPEVTGDSIFAVIAEEMGFVFSVLFIFLIVAWLWRGFKVISKAPDSFGRYLGLGILSWLGWQTFINMASMLNILPLTGVPLPFVSAGGSALVTALSGLGILINISRQGGHNESL